MDDMDGIDGTDGMAVCTLYISSMDSGGIAPARVPSYPFFSRFLGS